MNGTKKFNLTATNMCLYILIVWLCATITIFYSKCINFSIVQNNTSILCVYTPKLNCHYGEPEGLGHSIVCVEGWARGKKKAMFIAVHPLHYLFYDLCSEVLTADDLWTYKCHTYNNQKQGCKFDDVLQIKCNITQYPVTIVLSI